MIWLLSALLACWFGIAAWQYLRAEYWKWLANSWRDELAAINADVRAAMLEDSNGATQVQRTAACWVDMSARSQQH